MNSRQAMELLIEEYPFLEEGNIRIIKQFVATDGRVSNTFLVESDKKGYERFIAKSFVHHPESLKKEYMVLQLLQQKQAPAPKLLIPNHELIHFLLMEYIDGIPASEALQQGHDISDIFNKIGETTGKANSIELETFGDILNPSSISWKEYFMEKLTAKLPLIQSLAGQDLFNK
jgi:predicted Ser/Thr protein kinase